MQRRRSMLMSRQASMRSFRVPADQEAPVGPATASASPAGGSVAGMEPERMDVAEEDEDRDDDTGSAGARSAWDAVESGVGDRAGAGRLALTVGDARFSTRTGRRREAAVVVRLEGPGEARQERRLRLRREAGRGGAQAVVFELEGMADVWLEVEVVDGGEDQCSFVGQVRRQLSALLQSADRTEAWYPLARRDGSLPGRAGTVFIRLEFESAGANRGTRPPPPVLREVLQRLQARPRDGGTGPPPQILRGTDARHSGDCDVTALATPRWATLDFRQLSVYQMQSRHVCSLARTVRRDLEEGTAGRPAMRGGPNEPEFVHLKESLPGRLERAFDRLPAQILQLPVSGSPVGARSPKGTSPAYRDSRRRESRETYFGAALETDAAPGSPGVRRGRGVDEQAAGGGGSAVRRGTLKLESAYGSDDALLSVVPSTSSGFPLRSPLIRGNYPVLAPSTAPAGAQRVLAAAEPILRLGAKSHSSTGGIPFAGAGIGAKGDDRTGEVMTIRTNCMLKILCPGKLRPNTTAGVGRRAAYTAR